MLPASVFLSSMLILPGLRGFKKLCIMFWKLPLEVLGYSPRHSPVGFLTWFSTDLGSANIFTYKIT